MGWKKAFVFIRTAFAGALAAVIIKVLYGSVRWTWVSDAELKETKALTPAIFAFWHGRMVMMVGHYFFMREDKKRRPYMLISAHGDGRLIATAVRLLGIKCVTGSSSRGGLKAILELIRRLEDGQDIGITPDGPRGPRYHCKDGIVLIAQRSGRGIVPLSYSVDKKWQLGSWDGMIIPKPFARGVLVAGAPIFVAPNEEKEVARKRIQDALHEITERADRYWSTV